MLNNQNQIIQSLLRDMPEMELMPNDLTRILEEELAKPAHEIDTDLVDELLELIGAEMPPEGAKENTWGKIEEKLSPKPCSKVITIAKRILMAVAILIVVFFASFGTATAFKWTSLLKLLAPVAETFDIYSDNNTPGDPSAVNLPYTDRSTGETQLQYTRLEEMPAEHQGCRVLPPWLPERFTFLQGSFYDDGQATVITAGYAGGEDLFTLTSTFLSNEDDISSYTYEYEASWKNPVSHSINGIPVTLYFNSETNRSACSWIFENVHFLAIGNLTEEELMQVLEALMAR